MTGIDHEIAPRRYRLYAVGAEVIEEAYTGQLTEERIKSLRPIIEFDYHDADEAIHSA